MKVPENTTVINTPRLSLVCCTKEMLEALFEGDEALGKFLQVQVPKHWTENGEPAFRWIYNKLTQPGAKNEWWIYLQVLKEENMLVGSCGYKGAPEKGMVEIGYEIAASYRGRGLATELANALIAHAFTQPEVVKVQAHTLAMENSSGSVLKKCGMRKMEIKADEEDGMIWRWEISRE